MNIPSLLRVGVAGTIVTVICCFTPLLVVLFGVIGLTAFTVYLDMILIPALVLFVLITVLALVMRFRSA